MIECDELRRFVGGKADRAWVRAALDADRRQVVALFVGGRDIEAAQSLWAALPAADRTAEVRTDFWRADAATRPGGRHVASGQGEGLTNHIERFGGTLRQRCGRLARKTLSFSKCTDNHVGAIGYFVRLYNACHL